MDKDFLKNFEKYVNNISNIKKPCFSGLEII